MRLFAKLTGGRVQGSRVSCSREARASTRPPVSISHELNDAIESAVVVAREPDDDGARVMVMSHVLRGAFIFSREEAAHRIRLAFPELGAEGVKRGVRYLESRVRLAGAARQPSQRRPGWVHGWMDER